MTLGMRQHRVMVLAAKHGSRMFSVIIRGLQQSLLSESAKDNYEKQSVRGWK